LEAHSEGFNTGKSKTFGLPKLFVAEWNALTVQILLDECEASINSRSPLAGISIAKDEHPVESKISEEALMVKTLFQSERSV